MADSKEEKGGAFAAPSLTGGQKQALDVPSNRRNSMSGYYQNVTQKGKLILPTALWVLLIIAGICFLSLMASLRQTMGTLDTLVELEQEQARLQGQLNQLNREHYHNHKHHRHGHRSGDRRRNQLEQHKQQQQKTDAEIDRLLGEMNDPFARLERPNRKQLHPMRPMGASVVMIDTSGSNDDEAPIMNPASLIDSMMKQLTGVGASEPKAAESQASAQAPLITANIDKLNVNINLSPSDEPKASTESDSASNRELTEEEKKQVEKIFDGFMSQLDDGLKQQNLPSPPPPTIDLDSMMSIMPLGPPSGDLKHQFHHHGPHQFHDFRPHHIPVAAEFPQKPMEFDPLGLTMSQSMTPHASPLANLLLGPMDKNTLMDGPLPPSKDDEWAKVMPLYPQRRPLKPVNDYETIFGKPDESGKQEELVAGDLKLLSSVLDNLVKQSESPIAEHKQVVDPDSNKVEKMPTIRIVEEPSGLTLINENKTTTSAPKENSTKDLFQMFFGPQPNSELVVAPEASGSPSTGEINNLVDELKKIEKSFLSDLPKTTEAPEATTTTTASPTTTAPLFGEEKITIKSEPQSDPLSDLMLGLLTSPQFGQQQGQVKVDGTNKDSMICDCQKVNSSLSRPPTVGGFGGSGSFGNSSIAPRANVGNFTGSGSSFNTTASRPATGGFNSTAPRPATGGSSNSSQPLMPIGFAPVRGPNPPSAFGAYVASGGSLDVPLQPAYQNQSDAWPRPAFMNMLPPLPPPPPELSGRPGSMLQAINNSTGNMIPRFLNRLNSTNMPGTGLGGNNNSNSNAPFPLFPFPPMNFPPPPHARPNQSQTSSSSQAQGQSTSSSSGQRNSSTGSSVTKANEAASPSTTTTTTTNYQHN